MRHFSWGSSSMLMFNILMPVRVLTSMELEKQIQSLREKFDQVKAEVNRIVIGQEELIEKMLIAIVANGHVLIEGVPGLAKTLLIKTLAKTLGCEFKRIQFTPDLMPSDIIGSKIYDPKTGAFYVRKGPIFTNILLADEINRAPPKTQSALLEAMQERQVTIDVETYKLTPIFIVFATQNPIEHEGTYPLPEAQLDRFLMKLIINYPERQKEAEILEKYSSMDADELEVKQIMDINGIIQAQRIVKHIRVERPIIEYILDLTYATREHNDVRLGISTRGALNLLRVAKARALLHGRFYVTFHDVKTLVPDVFRHRILLKPEAMLELNVEDIIKEILEKVPLPSL